MFVQVCNENNQLLQPGGPYTDSYVTLDQDSRRNSYFTGMLQSPSLSFNCPPQLSFTSRYGSAKTDPTSNCPDRGGGNHYNRGYNEQGNYSYNRGNYSRPDSYSESYAGPGHNYGPPPPRVPRNGHRMNADQPPYGSNLQPPYAQNGSYPGYDSGSGSGSGSHSADQLASYQTDPSSVNSSLDGLPHPHYQGQQKSDEQAIAESYGFNGFGPNPQLEYQQTGGSMYPNVRVSSAHPV